MHDRKDPHVSYHLQPTDRRLELYSDGAGPVKVSASVRQPRRHRDRPSVAAHLPLLPLSLAPSWIRVIAVFNPLCYGH
jgi:hypothetical protein